MCTTLLITAKDGAVVSGRTMEFGFDVGSDVMVIPAGTPMTGTLPKGTGISYKTTHGMIGANGLGFPVIIDGINDAGFVQSVRERIAALRVRLGATAQEATASK